MNQAVERFLHKRGGFVQPDIRILVRNQLYVSLGATLAIMLGLQFSPWSLAFAGGAVLVTTNFWVLARIAQALVYVRKGGPYVLFFVFIGKMILTGLALYVMIVPWKLPVWGLVAGLGCVAINVTVTGLIQARRKTA